jgi:tetratricopeptide (TPR) repeat protein
VKGKKDPVQVYRVIAPTTTKTRFDVSAHRGLTPFVGRERELELLLDCFERAKAGRGQAVSIISEAGVGKSRLLYELRKAVVNEDATFLEGKCLSYSRGAAYHLHIDVLKANFDIRDGDGDSEIREKVKKGFEIVGADNDSTLPYILELLSVKESGIDRISLSPEARKDRTIEALKQLVLRGSELRPLILAFEDLHWADKSSEEVLRYELEAIPGARVLMIFTYRPEFVHTWSGKSYHNQVNLNRLSNRESLVMVNHLLATDNLDRGLEEFILEKTEGIPFFLEEFIKSLRDLKMIERRNNTYCIAKDVQDMAIPSTIQDVIMARVDTLPDRAKAVLQTGSVVGREFSHDLIVRVMQLSEQELLSQLSVLKSSELLYERGIYPELIYVFKHALTNDIAYDSLLVKKKTETHEKIAVAIEELYAGRLEQYYQILAEHFIKSRNYERAAEYSQLAAESAERSGSIGDAISYAEERVSSLERLMLTDEVQNKIIEGRTALGLYKIRMMYYSEAKEAVEPIVASALQSDDKRTVVNILTILGNYEFFVEESVSKALEHLENAIKISEEIEDSTSLGFTSWRLGVALSLSCEFEKAAGFFEKAAEINIAANNSWGISVTKSFLSYFIYFLTGKMNIAYQAAKEAVQIAEESDDVYSKAVGYTAFGISCYGKGFLAEAKEHLFKGAGLCEKINLFVWNAIAHWNLGEIYYQIGKFRDSKKHFSAAFSSYRQAGGLQSLTTLLQISLEMAKVMNNERDIELEWLYAYENKLKQYEGWKLRYIGQIVLNIDDQRYVEAEDLIKQAIEADAQVGMKWYLGRDYTLYADFLKRKGDQRKANENLNKAIELFKECEADGWVKMTEEEMRALSS